MYFHFNAVITGKENFCNIIRFEWSADDIVGFRFINLGRGLVGKLLFVVKLNLSWTVLGRNEVKVNIRYITDSVISTDEKPTSSKFGFTVIPFLFSML